MRSSKDKEDARGVGARVLKEEEGGGRGGWRNYGRLSGLRDEEGRKRGVERKRGVGMHDS